ncbi:amino acid permease [Candidatus Midichloria mitochondrii]|uniref:Amino acid permease n=1 Tax=Midichloria mitochondrii (strain IricVA) TaxID=696127 RepID=F7XW38_MIDMI|nr:aromatic amino acid transport family protein [Candidatus Midichloria mitochondrii]AEI88887.1 amino acid permease [Candidatus Midichloria mitochondrii IricVA]
MNRTVGGVCLIAGTAIGSGVLALPIILASLGIFYSITLMLTIWLLTYYTSLVSVELSLQAGQGLALGRLGRLYSGKGAELLGILSIKIISYSLLAVFIYGISSVIQKMLIDFGIDFDFKVIAFLSTCSVIGTLSLSMGLIDRINRMLFYALLFSIGIIIFGLLIVMDWTTVPIGMSDGAFKDLRLAVPILFTSFGYQTIFATLVQYCRQDSSKLKKACFWGSFIPTITYILWFVVILVVINNYDPYFYSLMTNSLVDVGSMILKLSQIANITYMQIVIWCLSILAILTSLLGVGMGLMNSWEDILNKGRVGASFPVKVKSLLLAFIPSLFIALVVPDAFIKMLSFAGMILVIIAVLLPLYLLQKIKTNKLHYSILTSKFIRSIAAVLGIVIILMEIINIFYKGI